MRTTLELDDDLVATARQLARQQGVTLGRVISELARQSLPASAPLKVRNGVLLFEPKVRASQTDLRGVNDVRDEA
ncbi:MAG: type II toxin-antitoxin system VapB family antitoxin [Bryobacteraceae bacterium]|nr:type II toxin-antitoxin system VapB family antitoxin [Bryobacteraceae bacterium]